MRLLRRLALATALAAFPGLPASAFQVQQSWIDRYDGPVHMNDYGEAVTIAEDGSVYMAGASFEQVSSGLYAPRFITIRYDPAGTRLWARTYAGTFASGAAFGKHIAIDGDGNILVGGSTNQGGDWAIVKYDPDGNELWHAVYDADSSFLTAPEDMAVDSAGNIYLVGMVGDDSLTSAGAIVKFSAAGEQQWFRRDFGPDIDGAAFEAVAVDDEGNVYVAGTMVVTGRKTEFTIVKYDPAGSQQWVAMDGSLDPSAYDYAYDVAVDSSGDIVAVGSFGAGSFQGIDLAVARYGADGTQLWRELYAGPAGRADAAKRVAIDGEDAIVVVGYSGAAPSDSDALTLKYDSAGMLLWEQRVAGNEIYSDRANAVALDSSNRIYVAGQYDPIGGSRYFTVSYDTDGTERWFMDYAGPLGGDSQAWAVAVGEDGSVAVTGESPGAGTALDIATIRYQQEPDQIPGDLDGDGIVGFFDLVWLLSAWGPCPPPPAECIPDIDGDGSVGFADLIELLAHWS